ncbi:MAG: nucleotidyl transferase AbiEii/AbiGii toxin family protein [Oligoflexia bacterium]|nr:nucleotidyl transferase AbiEii/AbiGii toxin family protein [Oligoflexia bacterium]
MKILNSLNRVSDLLARYAGSWGICGGVAACIYRDVPRFTGDIDIALTDHSSASAQEIAKRVLSELGYTHTNGFVTDANGRLFPDKALIIGRENNPSAFLGIDFLLPIIPWVPRAVERAQSNCLDYGIKRLPTITIEDLCLAKLSALIAAPQRGVDREDIIAILRTSPMFDRQYFNSRAQELELIVPADLLLLFPKLQQ